MGRHSLRLTIVLGLLITVLGSTGIFAVFTDRATTGPNSVTSGTLPHAADLKVAVASELAGEYLCDRDNDGQYEPADSTVAWDRDDSLTSTFSVGNLQPGETRSGQAFCLHNAGSSPLNLSATAVNVVNSETACTGDEFEAGDLDCGPTPPGQVTENVGELGNVIVVDLTRIECASVAGAYQEIGALHTSPSGFDGAALGVGAPLAPGATTCVIAAVRYPSTTSADAQQRAQSDRVTWQFAYDGVAS
ncbi:MAG TPA: hypothetical protein VHR16_08420 [Candidatus Limnocylindrales bacterium]|nr:hypothetical protein [Candidatus Limnocylindrales bacterium]